MYLHFNRPQHLIAQLRLFAKYDDRQNSLSSQYAFAGINAHFDQLPNLSLEAPPPPLACASSAKNKLLCLDASRRPELNG